AVMVRAAVARAAAFAGSGPEHAKLTFATQTSRRSLLTFSLPEYVAAPDVDHDLCAARRGCRACVDVCPQGAISLEGGRIGHDRNLCEPCGRCVTACPTGATENPAATAAQLEAQVRALLAPAGEARGIVYRCRRGSRVEAASGWYPVTVPCTAMLTAGWLLAPLVLGAGSVAVRSCTDSGCPLNQDAVVVERVDWCHRFLAAVGLPVDRVTRDPDSGPPAPALAVPAVAASALRDPFGPLGAAVVLGALAAATATTEGVLETASGPVGVVDIDPAVCTGCGTCVASCPTGALRSFDADGRRSISFDANACVACGACASRCPEGERGAIAVRAAVDVGRLRAGRTVLSSSELVLCRSCGEPVAPAALLARIAALVDDERILASLTTRCQDCRGLPVA
ncbi:MAG TPA: 4Fe-4S binding protein, partial [Acidimicrobiales bacterium]|nr:4Fe-4S binding protein [Acidimicrobiales bacterium]